MNKIGDTIKYDVKVSKDDLEFQKFNGNKVIHELNKGYKEDIFNGVRLPQLFKDNFVAISKAISGCDSDFTDILDRGSDILYYCNTDIDTTIVLEAPLDLNAIGEAYIDYKWNEIQEEEGEYYSEFIVESLKKNVYNRFIEDLIGDKVQVFEIEGCNQYLVTFNTELIEYL